MARSSSSRSANRSQRSASGRSGSRSACNWSSRPGPARAGRGRAAALFALAPVPRGALVAIEAQLGLITAGLVVMLVIEAGGHIQAEPRTAPAAEYCPRSQPGGGPARPDVIPDQAAGE